jgi:tRNA dimethylallyltransferase
MNRPNIIVIAGPTAIGKSGLGVQLAQRLDAEIVSADSIQLYRGFDIGSATPDEAEQGGVPHHMLNVLEPEVVYSASNYAEAASEVLTDIVSRGKVPIVVGGSGLYLRALLFGLSDSPGRDEELRQELYRRGEEEGLDTLHDEVKRVDPDYAAKIHPNDRVRIVRALEVYELTGKPLSDHHDDHDSRDSPYRIAGIGLSTKRTALHERIGVRARSMLDDGLIEEVRERLDEGVSPDCQPMQSIGYQEVLQFLDGSLTREELPERIARNTRRFAKRQITWFRKDAWLWWLDARTLDDENPSLLEAVHRFLDGDDYEYGVSDERPISDTS